MMYDVRLDTSPGYVFTMAAMPAFRKSFNVTVQSAVTKPNGKIL